MAEYELDQAKFDSEAQTLEGRWSKTDFLSGIENKFMRLTTSVLLENQRLMNSVATDTDEKFNALSIKLVAKVFPQLLVHKIASMQPLLGPTGLVYYLKYKLVKDKDGGSVEYPALVVESEEVVARTRRLKTRLELDTDYEADVNVDVLAQKLVNEFNHEVLTDIYNNCGTVAKWDIKTALSDSEKERMESLYVKLCEISSIIHRKILRDTANFFVVSQKTFDKYGAGLKAYHKAKIYVPEGWEEPGILIGYRGESIMDSGYHYSPYIPFTRTPVVDGDEKPLPSGLLYRYGKKLLGEGSKFYARLEILDNE